MKKCFTAMLIMATLLLGAGEKEFGKLLNDLSVKMDNLSIKIENAKTPGDIAKALKSFTKETKPLVSTKNELSKKYPKLFVEDAELPSSVIPQADKLAKSSERYNEAMSGKVDLMDDESVQVALEESEKIFVEFTSLIGSDDDEMDDYDE